MRSMSLAKLLATSIATIGLLVGCAGSDTKEEPKEEVKKEAVVVEEEAKPETAPVMAEAATEESNTTDSASMNTTYEVVAGDNLWDISGKSDVYSDSFQWPLIYKANRDKIKDADLIYAGQSLDIDGSASQADMDAAINHAKTRGAWSLGTQEASDAAYLGE